MSNIYLQLATSDDIQLLQESALKAFAGDYEKYGLIPPDIRSTEWFKIVIDKKQFYKVLCGDEFVGAICVECFDSNSIEIKYLYIESNFQNKNIGSQVMFLIEEQYSSIDKWTLVTPYKSYKNHYFYEKLGYKKVGEYQLDPLNKFKLFKYSKNIINRV